MLTFALKAEWLLKYRKTKKKSQGGRLPRANKWLNKHDRNDGFKTNPSWCITILQPSKTRYLNPRKKYKNNSHSVKQLKNVCFSWIINYVFWVGGTRRAGERGANTINKLVCTEPYQIFIVHEQIESVPYRATSVLLCAPGPLIMDGAHLFALSALFNVSFGLFTICTRNSENYKRLKISVKKPGY